MIFPVPEPPRVKYHASGNASISIEAGHYLSKFHWACMIALAVFVFAPSQARADAGVPMLFIIWPSAWLLMLAIIPIEAFIAFKILKTGWKDSFKFVTSANIASTLVGIPLTWLGLVVIQLTFGGGSAYGLDTDLTKLLAVTLQSPWLIPYEEELDWMIPAAAAVLCVPFFFTSVVVEYKTICKFIAIDKRKEALRWSWIANGITYGLIILGLMFVLGQALRGNFRDTWGYVDLSGKFTPQPKKVTRCGSFSDGLASIRIGRKWGYVDKTGKQVIAAQFHDAKPFSDGLAAVALNRKCGFIDKTGQMVIKLEYEEVQPFSESLACVRKGEFWGFIDTHGNIVVPLKYMAANSFTGGLALVTKGNNQVYINKSGQVVFDLNYHDLNKFSEGLSPVNGGKEYIDTTGKVILTLPDAYSGRSFSEGMASAYDSKTEKKGFINRQGNLIIPIKFDDVEPFSEGLACVSIGAVKSPKNRQGMYSIDNSNVRYGYVDKIGNFVIPPTFTRSESFSDGRAAVCVKGKWGFIDKTGKMVIAPEYSYAYSFHEGLAAVKKK